MTLLSGEHPCGGAVRVICGNTVPKPLVPHARSQQVVEVMASKAQVAAAAKEAERKKKAEKATRAAAQKKKKDEEAAKAAAAAAVSTRAAKKKSGAAISGGLTKPQLERASREVLFAFCEAAVRGHGDKLADRDKITDLSNKEMTKDTMSSLLLDAHSLGAYEGAPDPNDFPPAKKPAVGSKLATTDSGVAAQPSTAAAPPTTGDAATTSTSTVSQMLTSMTGAGGGAAFANAVASARTNGDLLKAQLFLEQTLGQFFEFERDAAGTFQVSLTARGRDVFRGASAPALSGIHHKVLDDLAQACRSTSRRNCFARRRQQSTLSSKLPWRTTRRIQSWCMRTPACWRCAPGSGTP